MSKFCGNCGTPHDDNATQCVNCGAVFPGAQQAQQQYGNRSQYEQQYSNQQYQQQYNNQQQYAQSALPVYQAVPVQNNLSEKKKRIITLSALAAVIVILLVLGIIIIASITGYKAVVNQFEKAYSNYNYEQIVDMYSETTFYQFSNDTDFLDKQTAQKIENTLSYFDTYVGHDYKIKYEIIDDYEMAPYQFENFIDSLSYFDNHNQNFISKIRVVELRVTASEGKRESSRNIKLILTKEEGKWKIAEFYNY